MKKYLLILVLVISGSSKLHAQVLLYENHFENPLSAPFSNCGPDLDANSINSLWGGTGTGTGGGGSFTQQNTVETILINGPNNQYNDPGGVGGNFSLGFLSAVQDDKLALTLNSQNLAFISLSFSLAGIDLGGCGGPFGVTTPVMNVKLFNTPSGSFNFALPGTLLDEENLTGVPASPFTFNWTTVSANLSAVGATNQFTTIVFDLTASGYGSMDNVIINATNVVSADMISFTGRIEKNKVLLNWKTENEINASHYEVEQSADGDNFKQIARVYAKGNSPNLYSNADLNPMKGINFYRLKQVDKNNSFKYSPVLKIYFTKLQQISVYPNPATDKINISFPAGGNRTVSIYSAAGTLVKTIKILSAGDTGIPVHDLAKGKYIIQVSNGVTAQTASFIKE